MSVPIRPLPEPTVEVPEIPEAKEKKVRIPKASKLSKPIPTPERPENCVTLQNETIEIRPTKMKYFRNRTASIYKILKLIPLNDFLAYEPGTFDPTRDSDTILFDFLTAVFDDAEIVKKHYDDMTADDIERILEIFGRLNRITEKEEASRKNKEAQVNH